LGGGNSYFTAGAIRTTYGGLDDLRPVLEDLSDEQAQQTELSPYTPEDFMADMQRVTQGALRQRVDLADGRGSRGDHAVAT
jgi:tricarballylate dehydrogenase